ncbi:MAG: DUF3060 domain-containing protein [Verrucomicrobiales bacterium]|nr:DUF3060 domain-containing protein [Verrucomicrobiales bacterium]
MTPAFSDLVYKTFLQISLLVVLVLFLSACASDPGGKACVVTSTSAKRSFHSKKWGNKYPRATSRTLTRSARDCVVSTATYGSRAPIHAEPVKAAAPVEKKAVQVEDVVVSETLTLPVEPLPVVATPVPTMPQNFKEEPAEAARKNILVKAKGADQIIVADDDNVTIEGSGGIVMISGRCVNLTLKADKTEIYCDIATNVSITGDDNSITLGTIGECKIPGNNNKVSWESGFTSGTAPKIESTGEGNVLKKRTL